MNRGYTHDLFTNGRWSSHAWDTPLNRAINKILRKELHTEPATGCVVGAGNGAKWKVHYPDTLTRVEKRERRKYKKSAIDSVKYEQMKAKLKSELKAESEAENAAKAKAAIKQAAKTLLKWADHAYTKAIQAWVEQGAVGPMPQFCHFF